MYMKSASSGQEFIKNTSSILSYKTHLIITLVNQIVFLLVLRTLALAKRIANRRVDNRQCNRLEAGQKIDDDYIDVTELAQRQATANAIVKKIATSFRHS